MVWGTMYQTQLLFIPDDISQKDMFSFSGNVQSTLKDKCKGN